MPESLKRKDHRNSGRAPLNPPGQAERAEMTGNDRGIANSGLTTRQQGALPVIAAAPSIAQAARYCRVSEFTIRRWLADPTFAEQPDLRCQQFADQASRQSLGFILRGVNVLAEAMKGPDQALRLRAARYAMSYAVQIREAEKFSAEIRELREALDSRVSRPSSI